MPPAAFFELFAFVFGATVGSFLNVVIHRLPRGESVVRPRSRCPACGTPIPGWHNVPLLSWVVLRARCGTCRAPISVRYPLVELMTGMLFLAAVRTYGLSLAALMGIALSASLVAISFIDIDVFEIPDEITFPGVLLGLALRPFAFDVPWWDGLLGAAIGAGFLALIRWGFFLIRKIEGMGLGDVKLIAMLGAFLGPKGLLPVLLVASLVGTVVALALRVFGVDPAAPPEPAPSEPGPGAPAPSEPAAEPAGSAATGEDEEEDWVPPAGAVPFGPFLAIGGLFQFFFGGLFERWLHHLG